jgi:hypothetical protein
MIDTDIIFEAFGWMAVILTFLTYSQKTMLRLRIIGIASNITFILWAASTGVYQPLILHACLLPLNSYRLFQILRMKRDANAAHSGSVSPLHWLRPFVKPQHYRDGDYVFRMGDKPDRLYYLVSGSVVFDELYKRANPGEIFGEVAFLTSERARTASARCEGDCEILALDASDLATVSLQHPAFNFYIMRVVAERLNNGTVPATADPVPFPDT